MSEQIIDQNRIVEGDHKSRSRPEEQSEHLTLARLERLRWFAVFGQFSTVSIVALAGIDLPLRLLYTLIASTAFSNLVFPRLRVAFSRNPQPLLAGTLILDTLLLTTMLYYTGGAHNPFTSFYLLHLMIAALALDMKLAWLMMGLCALCFSLLFLSPYSLDMPHNHLSQITLSLHLEGMLVAFILTGLCVNYFITNLRRALHKREAELDAMHMRAGQSERLAALATLAAGVAHELATPLGTIAVISKDLERSAGRQSLNRTLNEDARLIRDEVKRCSEILGRLNRDSTCGVGDASEWLTVNQIVIDLSRHIAPIHRQCLEIDNRACEEFVLAPKDPLVQALVTLIKNAYEAGGPYGRIRLRINTRSEKLCFEVRDDGPGIDSELTGRLGEPFFTTKEPGQGMGLGLFLVRTLAAQLGGALDIVSAPGSGSRFTLSIPSPSVQSSD